MTKKIVFPLLIIVMATLNACQALPGGEPSDPTQTNPPSQTVAATPFDGGEETQMVPTQEYKPQPDDENLERGEVFLDEKELIIRESFPQQIVVHLAGNLPTPCHALRVEIPEPNAQDEILINVYSVYDPDEICAQVLEPFDVNIQLQGLPEGTFSVSVNGDQIGEFSTP